MPLRRHRRRGSREDCRPSVGGLEVPEYDLRGAEPAVAAFVADIEVEDLAAYVWEAVGGAVLEDGEGGGGVVGEDYLVCFDGGNY